MKKSIFSLLLVLSLLLGSFAVYAAGPDAGVGKDEIPYGPNNSSIGGYRYSEFNMMTEAEAKASGVPAGSSGYVLALTNSGGNAGFIMDFGDRKVPVSAIESITFRVWCSENTKEVRITDNVGKSWFLRAVPSAKKQWIEITMTRDGKNFADNHVMADFADENGFFKPVNFGFRFTDDNKTTVYIDSITVNMREPDTEPPVITYEGEKTIKVAQGAAFSPDATAFDKYENRAVEVKQLWSENAFNADGNLQKGSHICTLQATDLSGNTAEIKLSIEVGDQDTEAPVICFTSDTLHVATGSFNFLKVAATDNVDTIETVLTWSDGTFDSRGRFAAGTHTLTVTATDNSGNKTEKQITVTVSDTPAAENVISDTQ